MANRPSPDTEHHRGTTSAAKQSWATNVQSRICNTRTNTASHHLEKCRGQTWGKFRRSLQTVPSFLWSFTCVYDIFGNITNAVPVIIAQHEFNCVVLRKNAWILIFRWQQIFATWPSIVMNSKTVAWTISPNDKRKHVQCPC